MSTNGASGLSSPWTATPAGFSASASGTPRARDASVDALRGLAIILVVLGHAILDAGAVLHGGPRMVNMGPFWIPLSTASSVPLSLLYSFHMPLFAFVSGLVMWSPRERPLRHGISSRARGLLVPYAAWFLVLYAINWSPHPAGGFGSALLDALVGRGGLWYLYALFVCTTVVLCLAKSPRSRFVLPASALVAVAFSTGWLFAVPDFLYLSWVLWIYPFVVLGYLVAPLRTQALDRRWLVVAVGLVAFLPLFYLRYPVHVPSLQPINRIRAASGAVGVVAGHVLPFLTAMLPYACASAAVLAPVGAYLGRGGWVIEAQAWLGRRSLGIYAMHGVFTWWFASHGLKDVFVLTLLSLGLSALATAALERTPVVGGLLLGQRVERILEPRRPPRLLDLLGIGAIERGMKRTLGNEPEVLEPDPGRSL